MKNVLILLPKGFELFEAAAFSDVFGWARDVMKQEVQTCFCGLSREVKASFGRGENHNTLMPSMLLDEIKIDDYDALAIPGGFGRYGYYEEGLDEQVLSVVRAFHAQGKPIAAVCTAALILAKSGILNEGKATIYNRDDGGFVRQLEEFGVDVSDEDVVVSEKVITSSGPNTAPLVALALLELLISRDVASKVANVMGYGE